MESVQYQLTQWHYGIRQHPHPISPAARTPDQSKFVAWSIAILLSDPTCLPPSQPTKTKRDANWIPSVVNIWCLASNDGGELTVDGLFVVVRMTNCAAA